MKQLMDGTSIYLTCDIGGAIERYEQHKFDEMLCVISSQQDLHTAQFIKMLHLDGVSWGVEYRGIEHAKRTVVFLVQIIREAASVMHEQMKKDEEKYAAVEDPEQTSVEVGLTGIKIQDMAANRTTTSTGPDDVNPELLPLPAPEQIAAETLAEQPAAREITFFLGTYPDVVRTALRTHEPSGVVTFAFRLVHAISSAWEMVVVKGETDVERARARMWLYLCARDVLGAAMRPLERM
ncbi:hypothetical protein BC827DRAFT_1375193 [Russula dissimulans]|nr:hypothetical protein BC827DRAFT_1375193 [Russula dissimulans]